jgi:hypothetical protein
MTEILHIAGAAALGLAVGLVVTWAIERVRR